MPEPAVKENVMKKNAEETQHDDEETGSEHVRNTTAQHVPDTGKEDATLSHCRLIFVHRPPSCGKTSIARGFAMTLYGSYGSGNGLPLYMKPVNRWWDGYRGQPVASLWPVPMIQVCNGSASSSRR